MLRNHQRTQAPREGRIASEVQLPSKGGFQDGKRRDVSEWGKRNEASKPSFNIYQLMLVSVGGSGRFGMSIGVSWRVSSSVNVCGSGGS